MGEFREEQKVLFYGFQENLDTPEVYDPSLEKRFPEVLKDFRPDIVHIFGTEFPHTLAMIKAFHRPEKTLLGIQEIYVVSLLKNIWRIFRKQFKIKPHSGTNSRKDSLIEQQDKYRRRARMENESIKMVGHITEERILTDLPQNRSIRMRFTTT